MSFALILQMNNSEKIRLDKELTDVAEVSANLKATTSIVRPVFLVALGNKAVPSFNYVSCAEFGRSYFVTDIKATGGGLWEVSCEVDVLTSFASEIRNNTAVVKRNEANWNLYLNDGVFRSYQDPHIIIKNFPNGFSTLSPSFILAVAGGAVDE